MNKTLTVKELIAKKEKIKKNKEKTATLFVESLDAEITVKAPTTSIMLEAQDVGGSDATKADAYVLINCVTEPNLKDEELQKAYDCVEPLEVPSKIFLPGEVSAISVEIMKLAGYFSEISKVGKELKN